MGEKAVKKQPYLEYVYLECGCESPNHTIRLRLEGAHPKKLYGPTLDLEVVTPPQAGFWRRLGSFLKGDDCAYIGPDVVVTRESAERMRDLLDRYLLELDKYEVGG